MELRYSAFPDQLEHTIKTMQYTAVCLQTLEQHLTQIKIGQFFVYNCVKEAQIANKQFIISAFIAVNALDSEVRVDEIMPTLQVGNWNSGVITVKMEFIINVQTGRYTNKYVFEL